MLNLVRLEELSELLRLKCKTVILRFIEKKRTQNVESNVQVGDCSNGSILNISSTNFVLSLHIYNNVQYGISVASCCHATHHFKSS